EEFFPTSICNALCLESLMRLIPRHAGDVPDPCGQDLQDCSELCVERQLRGRPEKHVALIHVVCDQLRWTVAEAAHHADRARVLDGNDLVVLTVHDQGWDIELLEVPGKVGKVSWVASALPYSEGAAYKRQGREVAACLR